MEKFESFLDFIMGIYNSIKDTEWKDYAQYIIVIIFIMIVIGYILIPLIKIIGKLCAFINNRKIRKKIIYQKLSFMNSSDVYYAIKNYIPTRFSQENLSDYDEMDVESKSDGFNSLLEQFLKHEYKEKTGDKYYLCLGDCGMGKTTFLINLYYQTLKLREYKCEFISLQKDDCIEAINKIDDKSNTILLLDGLDENKKALTDYESIGSSLEKVTCNFYRVIITVRTNFFENESKERISNNKSNISTLDKLLTSKKYYITPFTNDDIIKHLQKKYHYNVKKINKALNVINKNKKLSKTPLLLRYIDDLLDDDYQFKYDYQFYEYLFDKWIKRESLNEKMEFDMHKECLIMAKRIYYEWLKNGSLEIYYKDIKNNEEFTELENIQLKGHALINRTGDGMYKFSHISYWEFLLAKLSLSDIWFSDLVMIKNFDGATHFLEEMKDSQNNNYEQNINLGICVANYDLKYKRPEDAEKLYKNLMEIKQNNENISIYIRIKLAECYWHLLKYESSKNILDKIYDKLEKKNITKFNKDIYTKFASIFAIYCNEYKYSKGQNIISKIIYFYEENNIYNYELLNCYDAYSTCCINYRLYEEMQKKVNNAIDKYFKGDQYAEYLQLRSQQRKLDYGSESLLKILKKQIKYNSRFMDVYDNIIFNSEMIISAFSLFPRRVSQEISYEFFKRYRNEIWVSTYNMDTVYKGVYGDSIIDKGYNSYKMINKLTNVYSAYEMGLRDLEIDSVIEYSEKNNMQNEMKVVYAEMFRMSAEKAITITIEIEENVLKALILMKGNDYKIAELNLRLYYIYKGKNETLAAKKKLRELYNMAVNKKELSMTMLCCDIFLLAVYDLDFDTKYIINELIEITPKVYGNNKKANDIYTLLKAVMDDDKLLNIYTSLQLYK